MKSSKLISNRTPLILVSTSPRRISLLGDVRLPIEVESPDTDETRKRGETPHHLVSRLAREKAESAETSALQKHPSCILLAADTIVVAPDGTSILGKPKDQKDAFRMMRLLSGKTHTVLTGYCLLLAGPHSDLRASKTKKHIVRVVRSQVKMRTLTPDVIRKYISTGEPMDKAGSYGAQGMGMAFIEKINGSYTNVVGLPIAQVLLDLEKLSHTPILSWIS